MKDNVINLVCIFAYYWIFVVLLPWIVTGTLFCIANRIKSFFAAFIFGNFVVINLVFGLAFLKIYNRYTFILGYFIIMVGVFCLSRYRQAKLVLNRLRNVDRQYKDGVLKKRSVIKKGIGKFFTKIKKKKFNVWIAVESIIIVAILVWVVSVLGYRSLVLESFSAPDEEVHLQWVQSLLNNKIYHSGIYPFGMHNLVSSLCLLTGKTAAQVLKYFGVVVSTTGFLICYLAVRAFTKNKIAALTAFTFVFTTNLFSQESFSRFQFPVPHEFAIPFFIILTCFLIWYLQDGERSNLILFGACVSLTLFSHFHTAIVAAIFCVCAAVVYIVHIFKSGKYKYIFLCGMVSVLIGIWPVLIGMVQGIEFEQSMAWAVSVMQGHDNLSQQNERQEEEFGEEEEEEEDKTYPLFSKEVLRDLTDHSYSNLKYTEFILVTLCAGVILFIIRILIKRKCDGALDRLPYYIFSIAILIMMVCEIIGLPVLIYSTRLVSYLFWVTCFIIASPMEELYRMVEKWKSTRIAVLCLTGGLLISGETYIYKNQLYTKIPLFYYFQTTGTNRAVSRIIDTYPRNSWTVVSVVTETSMVYRDGFHYEWIDFLEEVEEGKSIKIPTKYVFFIVEKMPIQKYGWYFEPEDTILKNRTKTDINDAYKDLEYEENREDYYKYQREIIMAKAQKYINTMRVQYPLEFSVYYEDDEVAVYRLKQNEGYNELSIPYK